MIRTVRIPRMRGRLADTLETSQGCISYLDPTSNLWVTDDNTSGACTFGDGSSYATPVYSGDPGLSTALQEFAAGTTAQSNSDVLNSLLSNSSGNPASSPIPGPGLGLVTLPSSLKLLLEIGAGVLILFLLFGQQTVTLRRSRS